MTVRLIRLTSPSAESSAWKSSTAGRLALPELARDVRRFLDGARDHRSDATVFQDAAGQGAGALDAALKLAKGEKVEHKVYVPFQLVTPANIDKFLKKN